MTAVSLTRVTGLSRGRPCQPSHHRLARRAHSHHEPTGQQLADRVRGSGEHGGCARIHRRNRHTEAQRLHVLRQCRRNGQRIGRAAVAEPRVRIAVRFRPFDPLDRILDERTRRQASPPCVSPVASLLPDYLFEITRKDRSLSFCDERNQAVSLAAASLEHEVRDDRPAHADARSRRASLRRARARCLPRAARRRLRRRSDRTSVRRRSEQSDVCAARGIARVRAAQATAR